MSRCPSQVELEAHASGAESSHAPHIEGCDACRRALERIREDSATLDRLRTAVRSTKGARTDQLSVPGFEITRELGRGGQGVVHEAVQLSTGRKVALKLLAQGQMATAGQRSRFERETQLAAKLRHPGLVTVYEAGRAPSGIPYLALELVDGEPWSAWTDRVLEQDAERAERRILEAFVRLCEALGHAHERGVLHRDVKPSNVLVDEDDQPHVLDLGLARLTEDASSGSSYRTQTGELLGSLAWMSPERIAGKIEPGFSSDVFALGLLLHRGLTGKHAFPLGSSLPELVLGANELPGSIAEQVSEDLEWNRGLHSIMHRALARRAEERHENASELASDVAGVLIGDSPAVETTPPRPPRNHARTVAATVLAVVPLVWIGLRLASDETPGVMASTPLGGFEASPLGSYAAWEAIFRPEQPDESGEASPPGPGAPVWNAWRFAAAHAHYHYPLERRIRWDDEEGIASINLSPDGRRALIRGARGSFNIIRDTSTSVPGTPLQAEGVKGRDGWSHDGKWLCGVTRDSPDWRTLGTIHAWEVLEDGSQRVVASLENRDFLGVGNVRDLVLCLSADELEVRTLGGLELEASIALPNATSAAFSSDDRSIVAVRSDRSTVEWRWESGETIELEMECAPYSGLIPIPDRGWVSRRSDVAFHEGGSGLDLLHKGPPNGFASRIRENEIVLGSRDRLTHYELNRDSETRKPWRSRNEMQLESPIRDLSSQPRGPLFAVLRFGNRIDVFDGSVRGFPRRVSGVTTEASIHDAVPDQDGNGWWLGQEGRVLRVEGERVVGSWTIPSTVVFTLAVAPDGRPWFTTGEGKIGWLDTAAGESQWFREYDSEASGLAFSPSGALATASFNRLAVDVDPSTQARAGVKVVEDPRHKSRIAEVVWSPDGAWLAAVLTRGSVLWRAADGTFSFSEPQGEAVRALAFHPSGHRLATGQESGRISEWELGGTTPLRSIQLETTDSASVWSLSFSPDGRFLAAGSGSHLTVIDWESGRTLFDVAAHQMWIFAVEFHPELPVILTVGELGEALLWDFSSFDDLYQPGQREAGRATPR